MKVVLKSPEDKAGWHFTEQATCHDLRSVQAPALS